MGDDDKPFACSDCGMRFAIEDHLSVHKMKHQMSLTLTPGARTGLLSFVDQTPTPTKFLRNCEEIGLFNELNNSSHDNPFEEAFKKAAKHTDTLHIPSSSVSGQDSLNTPTPLPLLHLTSASVLVSETLNTPTPNLLRNESPPKPSLPRGGFNPLPGPNSETGSTVGSTPGEGSSQSPSDLENSSQGFALRSPEGAPKPGLTGIKLSPGSSRPIILGSKIKRQRSNSSKSQGRIDDESLAIPAKQRNIEMKSEVSSSDEMTIMEEEDVVSQVVPSPGSVSSQLGSPAIVPNSPGILQGAVPALATAGSPLVPATSLSKSDSQYLLQVMVQMPNGQMMPVHIPAAIASGATTVTTATPTVSKQLAVQPKSVPVTISAASSSSGSRTSASASIKQKLKETIKQNAQNNILNENMRVISDAAEMAANDIINYVPVNVIEPQIQKEPLQLKTTTSRTEILHNLAPARQILVAPPAQMRVQRQAADTSTPSSYQSVKSPECNEMLDAEERRTKFLERNRAAAARCRTKKKIWTGNLEKKAEELQTSNGRLQAEVTSLRSEVTQLKSLLLAHRDCPVTQQQQRAGQLTIQPVPELIQTINNNSVIIATETTPNIVTVATTTPTSQLTKTVSSLGSMGPVIVNVRSLKSAIKPSAKR